MGSEKRECEAQLAAELAHCLKDLEQLVCMEGPSELKAPIQRLRQRLELPLEELGEQLR